MRHPVSVCAIFLTFILLQFLFFPLLDSFFFNLKLVSIWSPCRNEAQILYLIVMLYLHVFAVCGVLLQVQPV